MFGIEDDTHAEEIGSYTCRADAMNELRRLQRLAWDEDPNWAACGVHVVAAMSLSDTTSE